MQEEEENSESRQSPKLKKARKWTSRTGAYRIASEEHEDGSSAYTVGDRDGGWTLTITDRHPMFMLYRQIIEDRNMVPYTEMLCALWHTQTNVLPDERLITEFADMYRRFTVRLKLKCEARGGEEDGDDEKIVDDMRKMQVAADGPLPDDDKGR